MATRAFDTHKAFKKLQEAGFDDTQAEAVISAVSDSVSEHDLATAGDLRELEAKLNAKMDRLEARMTMKMLGLTLASIGVTTGLLSIIMSVLLRMN